MAVVRYSVRAERDLTVIADYTLKRWGEDQVIRYLDGLEACCQNLAMLPALGRTCDDIRPGLRRMELGLPNPASRHVAGTAADGRRLSATYRFPIVREYV